MQPSPDCAISANAVASSPERMQKSSPQARRVASGRARSMVASLTPTMFGCSASSAMVSDGHVDHRTRRDVVDDHRRAGLGHRREVRLHAGLGRLVVVGHDDKLRRGAGGPGVRRQFDALRRAVGAGAGDDGHAAAGGLDADLHHPLVLVMAERRRFAGRAAGHQCAGAFLDLPVDQAAGTRPRRPGRRAWGVISAVSGALEHQSVPFPKVYRY